MGGLLVADFDGVVADAFEECALITWLGAGGRHPWAPGSARRLKVPTAFLSRFRTVRAYARTLDHFVVAHLPQADQVRGRQDFDRIFHALPEPRVRAFTRAASAARARIRTEEPDYWLGLHTLYPGIAGLLRRHAGAIAIVTAKDEPSVLAILDRYGLEDTVAEVVGECSRKADAVRELCVRHGRTPAEVTFLDDNLPNVRAVAATGARTLWATWGYHTRDDVTEAARDGVARLDLDAVATLELA
ncbi:HAD family hydrolase [Nonomuraea typhae]|uniref:HAD family hydrolase n=1 Tax=Nonomuraea typhae TaxID=2603600 RepID=UPI0012FBCE9A|nr:HAD family hydrolase [Nonomuraea typhae]